MSRIILWLLAAFNVIWALAFPHNFFANANWFAGGWCAFAAFTQSFPRAK